MSTLRRLCLLLLGLHSLTAQANPDLWSRLFAAGGLDQVQHPLILAEQQAWERREAELRVLLETRGHWLYPVLEAVEARGLPGELALLPLIESRLDPAAHSPSQAHGLWQILPATAASLNLQRNSWLDERADPLRATEAALDYLQTLHARFGAWPLALAAYNAGQGRVARALHRAREGNRRSDYWVLDLPQESRDYVPRLLGLYRAMRAEQNLRLPWIDPSQQPVALTLSGPLNVHAIAASSGTTVDTVYAYNPQWLRWAMPPDGPHRMLAPQWLVQKLTTTAHPLHGLPPIRWLTITVREGESLGQYAQRWQTTVLLLQRVNALPTERIWTGQQLLIPAGAQSLADATIHAAVQQRRVLAQDMEPRTPSWHLVRDGETLWSLARRTGRKIEELRRWNALEEQEPLYPGQRLRIAPPNGSKVVVHRLEHSESLPDVARRYGVSVDDLRRWNRLGTANLNNHRELLVFAPL